MGLQAYEVTIQPTIRDRARTHEVALRRLPSVRVGGPGRLQARLPIVRLNSHRVGKLTPGEEPLRRQGETIIAPHGGANCRSGSQRAQFGRRSVFSWRRASGLKPSGGSAAWRVIGGSLESSQRWGRFAPARERALRSGYC